VKGAIRKEILALRNSIGDARERSAKIAQNLFKTEMFMRAQCVFTYVSFKNEVDTLGIIRKIIGKKEVVVPAFNDSSMQLSLLQKLSDLKEGRFGILEPRPCLPARSEIGLVIVPGIAFDRKGNRVGFGGGYYDRILKGIKAPKVALSYSFQVLPKIPSTKHDVRMDFVVTEDEVIDCRAP
jgi:5-formyltetrahydrofolate cyclo-ligase